jgi:methionine synthase I (cobalamin-dependent)
MSWLTERVYVTDGAWGTELQKLGLALGESPDAWNTLHPERVAAVARSYVEAGSDIILTNTFRSNRISMGAAAVESNAAAAEISRKAVRNGVRVVASIGPTGKLLSAGDVEPELVEHAFLEQAETLARAGVDALLIETMSDIHEARLAASVAKSTGLPVIVSFTFDSGRYKDRTMMGATPEQAVEAMTEIGVDAIGANCGAGPEAFRAVAARLRAATPLPLWIKPNAGLPAIVEGAIRYNVTPEFFAAQSLELVGCGANFIGGCCGTTPEFIRALSAALGNGGAKTCD